MKWVVALIGTVAVLLALLSEVGRTLAIGWISFLTRNLPAARVNPDAILNGAVVLGVFVIAIHAFGLSCCRKKPDETPPRRWRVRWTLSIVVVVFLMFATGYAAMGLARQLGWILSSREPWYGTSVADRGWVRMEQNLKMVGMGFGTYHDVFQSLPPGGTFGKDGQPGHSWITMLLPYLMYVDQIDRKLPWNHPKNVPHFRSVVNVVINPNFLAPPLYDKDGFGLSHYAANGRVLSANKAMRHEEVTDGTSNTLLVGEVNDQFQPWGHPFNWRDPARGINREPDGFGGPAGSRGAEFLMMDGSVRFISQDVDPQVLKSLSTPAGADN